MKDTLEALNLNSLRARKARLGHTLGQHFFGAGLYIAVLFAGGGLFLYFLLTPGVRHWAFLAGAASICSFMLAVWYRGELVPLPPTGQRLDGLLSGEVLGRLKLHVKLTPKSVWKALGSHWQVAFITNHLLLPSELIAEQLSSLDDDMPTVWLEAARLADISKSRVIEPGHIVAALLRTSPGITAILTHMKSSQADVEQVLAWETRLIDALRTPQPYFGGIGRDWANGFTPRLNQYGENVSLGIERDGAHFGWLMESPGVQAMKNAFSQGAAAVALVGEPGVGKTSHAYALAQLLLQEDHDPHLEHRQIISLNASIILANARQSGELEYVVIGLLQEAIHAGHIILFLDDAQLFFQQGVGSFDITRVLLPVLQSQAVQLVLAMTPHDYQQLKASNSAFAGLLSPVMLHEPPEADVMHVLEDTASGLEAQHNVVITYEALHAAYRLGGRYDQDTAYPGKAIRLLEQALPHAVQSLIIQSSVEAALEQARGVKVGSAKPAEAAQLLHLEDAIHQRMINQSRAVSVVANALRRARAGVANPNRPIGSFLFLGPTGVGKTELAKSIAATYFGAESNMIRLDMTEYQQPSDVGRLLSSGENEQASLIMAVRQQPFTVVLLDEIEKAHPNVLNLLLQLLDEGKLTDTAGRAASFKDAVVIATSNAGANEIRERIGRGEELASFEEAFVDNLINSGQFKPELLNRFDEIVLFRPLKQEELIQLVTLMLGEVNRTLASQNISVELTPAAAEKIVQVGYDPRLGARPLRRELQRTVEDTIASRILAGQTNPGDHVVLDASDLATQVD